MHIPKELEPRYLELLEKRQTCGEPVRAALHALAREVAWKELHTSFEEVEEGARRLALKWISDSPPPSVKEQPVKPAEWSAGGECVASIRIKRSGPGCYRVTSWHESEWTEQCVVSVAGGEVHGLTCCEDIRKWVSESIAKAEGA